MNRDAHPARPAPGRRPRGPVRRFLEARGHVGGHLAPHVETRLVTEDGTRLAATYLPGPGGAHGPAVVLAHGFAANRRKPAYAYLADGLAQRMSVLSLDLRGHGRSGGVSTLGDREALDVAAGCAWLRAYGHPWVAAVGLSMGATSVLHAGARGTPADALVVVSATARFRMPAETAPMQRLASVWHTPWKRHGLRALLRVRIVPPAAWESPGHPEELAAAVAAPLLVVHGVDDAYFPVEDAEAIAARAAGPATLWIEPAGFGHAEDGITPVFVDALAGALLEVRATGRFPDQREAAS
ncbi:MAG: CocE/NonD family hydrolase [Actinobacteria bacterium]|nr:CocE/NonD family hydrolase [Actinomycetota bacterium]